MQSRRLANIAASALFVFSGVAGTHSAASQTIAQIVQTYAQYAISAGWTPGVAVGVVSPNQWPYSYATGLANVATATPFTTSTIFRIDSVTKIFTTAMLGQAVANGGLSLATSLQDLSAQVGVVQPLSGQVTLEELGDWTGGFPIFAPLCSVQSIPGCLPAPRPVVSDYGAADFLSFFQNTIPQNYRTSPPTPLSSLPGPMVYSDFTTGLLGLILAEPAGPITDTSIYDWYNSLQSNILWPLGMTSTYMVPPPPAAPLMAQPYAVAIATASVANGQITQIQVQNRGLGYSSPPAVIISGGGGDGAAATATVKKGTVTSINVTSSGQGYLAPPVLQFGASRINKLATAEAIIADGQVVAIDVTSGGAGYPSAPTVTISGGRLPDGRDATAVAHVAHGAVTGVSIVDGGAGYVAPLTVLVQPGDPLTPRPLSIWAPAGSLNSSVLDLTIFAAAALGYTTIGWQAVPPSLTQGFAIAEAQHACVGANPSLATCPANAGRIGLGWVIQTADPAHGLPQMVWRGGGGSGFSTMILLIPDAQIAVVTAVNTSHGVGPADNLAFQIAYALLYPPSN